MRFDPGAGSFSDGRLRSNGSRLLNCHIIPRVEVEGNPGSYFIQGAAGLAVDTDTGNGTCFGLTPWKKALYGVFGGNLYQVKPTLTLIGAIPGTGHCQFARERVGLAILRDGRQWIWDGTTLVEYFVPNSTDPETVSTIVELDGYTLYGMANSDKMYASLPLDPTNINALNFATAEARPDDLVRLVVNKLTLWLFGEETVELYYNAGQTGFPFLRYENAMLELGLLAPGSALAFHNAVYFLGSDRKIYRGEGLDAAAISLPWLEQVLEAAGEDAKLATAVTYSMEGVDFYALTVPNWGTYEWNSASKLWAHRTTPGQMTWRPQGYTYFQGNYYLGDAHSGKLFVAKGQLPKDDGAAMEFEVVSAPFGPKESRTSLNYVDTHMVPLDKDATPETFKLDYTDDEGRTFKGLRTLSWPIIGGTRAIARQLGWMRRRQLRWRYSGEAAFRMEDVYIDMASGWPRAGRYRAEQAGPTPQPGGNG